MNWILLVEQFLIGMQLGLLLFLLAAGLTLVFGIMDMVNLAHGSLYMIGGYFAATFTDLTGSILYAIPITVVATFAVGVVLEQICLKTLYDRDHLDQVLVTFGLILFFNEVVQQIWGPAGLDVPLPDFLNHSAEITEGFVYPVYRLMIIGASLGSALLLYYLVVKTRMGMLIRAGASNREMIGALGVNIKLLFTLVFGMGAALAGLAGLLAAPIVTVESGMGDNVLIMAFVVIVIGGIGSIRGAFISALMVGLIDTLGRSFLPDIMAQFLPHEVAVTAAPSISSMMIYLIMAVVLSFRPEGLFPPQHG